LLQREILPSFDAAEVQVVVIHCDPQGQTPAAHKQTFALSFPIVLDFESELFRRFRLPDHVFPLNAVIARDGTIAHVGVVLDDAVAVARALAQAP
jgi:peroxiredoxin